MLNIDGLGGPNRVLGNNFRQAPRTHEASGYFGHHRHSGHQDQVLSDYDVHNAKTATLHGITISANFKLMKRRSGEK